MSVAQFEWKLEAYQKQGNLWLRWNTNAPFRAQQGRIYVYKGDFPSNPTDNSKAWTWDTDDNHDWNTGLIWGTGWNCSYIAEAPKNGPYVYFMKITTNGDMGPNVARVYDEKEVESEE